MTVSQPQKGAESAVQEVIGSVPVAQNKLRKFASKKLSISDLIQQGKKPS